MRFKSITILLVLASLIITSCKKDAKISVSCDRDSRGNYIIKWEVYPKGAHDRVSIYMSDNDSDFSEPPVLVADINDYVANIESKDSLRRKFFRLKVGNSFSDIVTNRHFKLENVQNFRDLGGYQGVDGKRVKWGKIFRSGDFADANEEDLKVLENLHIKTIIDLRELEEYEEYPDVFKGKNMVHIPINVGNRAYIRDKIIDGSFLRGDAIIYTQDMYKSIAENHTEELKAVFDILCDPNNYPVVFHGHLGKDKTGFISALLLNTLGVSDEDIRDDYLMSNSCIFEQQVIGEAKFLPEQMQEAATVICKVNMTYLDYAKACIERDHGSVEEYMNTKIGLSPEKVNKLHRILE